MLSPVTSRRLWTCLVVSEWREVLRHLRRDKWKKAPHTQSSISLSLSLCVCASLCYFHTVLSNRTSPLSPLSNTSKWYQLFETFDFNNFCKVFIFLSSFFCVFICDSTLCYFELLLTWLATFGLKSRLGKYQLCLVSQIEQDMNQLTGLHFFCFRCCPYRRQLGNRAGRYSITLQRSRTKLDNFPTEPNQTRLRFIGLFQPCQLWNLLLLDAETECEYTFFLYFWQHSPHFENSTN